MKDLIAKRYVKALTQTLNQNELEKIQAMFGILASAWEVAKFQDIMESPYLSREKKEQFILEEILDNKADTKAKNFIKVLVAHDRLNIFVELFTELSSQIASSNREYLAKLIVSENYDDSTLKEIESKFSKKLGVNLLVKQQIIPDSGIKLVVEDLGIEVSFSQDKFINDLKNHILKVF